MRPVDKGAAPRNSYAKYQDAGPDLQTRLGDYCSYCERQIETHLAVEHVRPKSLQPALATDWDNLLLGCVNCNSCKGDSQINVADYFWPDLDNTMRAFKYEPGGMVVADPGLSPQQRAKAEATIGLLGLDRFPGSATWDRKSSDKRWLRRQQAWAKATTYRARLATEDTQLARDAIADVAAARGEFSIWWTVFDGDIDMRRSLRDAFPNTDPGSFGINDELLQRRGGQL